MNDYTLFKDNLERIINRGGYGNRTVSVDVLKRCKAVIEDNDALTRKLRAIEDIFKEDNKPKYQGQYRNDLLKHYTGWTLDEWTIR